MVCYASRNSELQEMAHFITLCGLVKTGDLAGEAQFDWLQVDDVGVVLIG